MHEGRRTFIVTREQEVTYENKSRTLARGKEDTYTRSEHLREHRRTLEGRRALTRGQDDTYTRAGRHLQEGRRAFKRG